MHIYYFNRDSPRKKGWSLLSGYCITGVTGHPRPVVRSLLVFPTRYDSFTTAGLRLGLFLTSWTAAALCLSHDLSFSLFLLLSPLQLRLELKHFHLQALTNTHTVARNHIKPFSAAFKEDSWAYFKPKVLISYNRLLCESWGSWYFSSNRPRLEGASCVDVLTNIKATNYKHHEAEIFGSLQHSQLY